MVEVSDPLVSRGAEALSAVINNDLLGADEQVRLLTLSELTLLVDAAKRLAVLAQRHVLKVCVVCGVAVVWDAGEPTGQAQRWRHVDQAASYEVGAHRAVPVA